MGEKIDKYGYTGQGGRKDNEDSYGIFAHEKNLCAAAADGLGGHGGGKQASQIVVQSLAPCGQTEEFPTEAEVRQYFQQANDEILRQRMDKAHMKTTAVWLCVSDRQAVWAHIGDSRLYHFCDGELVDHTLDHSVSQMAVALGMIKREEIPGHSDRSRLLRALGEEEFQVEFHRPVYLGRGRHAFLLCTDGFWGTVTEDEILQELKSAQSAEEWVGSLRQKIIDRKGDDNHTAVGILVDLS